MKKLIALFTLVVVVLSMTVGSFAAENNWRGRNNSESQGIFGMNVATVLEDGQNKVEAIGDNPRKAERMLFQSAFAAQFSELEALRVISKGNWTTIKGLNDKIRMAAKELREKNIELNEDAVKSIKDARAAIDAGRSQISDLQSDKKDAWGIFKAAVKEKDLTAAQGTIASILSLKQEVINEQVKMLPLKQALLDILTGLKGSSTPASAI